MLNNKFASFRPWLEVIALLAWGVLLIKYWLSGQLNLLIHPNYFALTTIAGGILLLVAGYRAVELVRSQWRPRGRNGNRTSAIDAAGMQHISLFPPGWSTALLLFAAILGFAIEPRVFASDKAMQRNVSDFLPVTQAQPKAFHSSSKPEERSLIDWVRILAVYPEPDAYIGQKVNVRGFTIHLPELPEQYLLVSRFIITCCAADAYPVGLPVKLSGSRNAYPPDTWLEIQGETIVETLADRRQLAILATSIREIPEPKNPYDY